MTDSSRWISILIAALAFSACTPPAQEHSVDAGNEGVIPRAERPEKPSANTSAMIWRFIGPIAGTRGSMVIGHPTEHTVFYHGASGGLWKTPDAGLTWVPLGDGQFGTSSVGAMEISLSDPDIMYVGMGEPQMRNNVSWGDGVYKSTDGGETWVNVGLADTHHIAQIRIHPTNPDLVYVAAYGHAFGPNPERGVYRTKDGGDTWEQVLFKSERAGAIDLVMNPANPDELFATIWEFERKAWGPTTGGDEGGIWKSTDGGDTWTDITYNSGLPEGQHGRIGLTMSAADPDRVYALIDSETRSGLYRSDDSGATWEFVSDYFQIIGRPFYYSHIYANPSNADELWSPNNRTWSSADGGKTWLVEPGIKDDFHDVWIDPRDANRMIATNDGGVQVSLTGGMSWSAQWTQKTTQIYRVHTDNDFPYNVYGNAQDVLAYKVPSASRWGGISGYETTLIGNGETGDVIPHPDDPNIVYSFASGSPLGGGAPFAINNLKTGQNEVRNIYPEPLFGRNASDLPYRFQWDSPMVLSKFEPGSIYAAGNVVFKTTDEGLNWEPISPDLTNDLQDKQVITGTPWLPEYFGQEIYSTIHRMAESRLEKGVLWTGSDDGVIALTRDGGSTWNRVSPPGQPEFSDVKELEPSPHDAGTLYVALTRYNTADDYKPYLYKTIDYGKTWTDLSPNFPQDQTTFTIREDPVRKGLLYVGTNKGIFASLDDGETWQPIQLNMPHVEVSALTVKDADLVAATNGRGFWILDDVTPLREQGANVSGKAAHLYSVSDHTRFGYSWWMNYAPGGDPGGMKKYFVQNMRAGHTYYELGTINGEKKRQFVDAGDAKPMGPMIYFRLAEGVQDVSISILDESGNEIVTHEKDALVLKYVAEGDESIDAGLNRFVWDMRYPLPTVVPGRAPTPIQPFAKPGSYTVKLTVDGDSQMQDFKLFMNPHEPYTQAQADARFEFWMNLYRNVDERSESVTEAVELRESVATRLQEFKDSGADASRVEVAEAKAAVVTDLVNEYEGAFVAVGRTLAEIINLPAKVFTKAIWLHNMMEVSEGPVTQPMREAYDRINVESEDAENRYRTDIDEALDEFEEAITD
jgi:photosystem II stability/assembly factor-like uncharacterized protein